MADDNKIKRLNYFTGQFLEAEDFLAEQQYHTAMRRRLNTALRSPGILDGGFKVTVTQATASTAARISVGAGIGVDNQGRELVILTSLEKEIPENDLHVFSGKTVAIYLGYDEKASDNKAADTATVPSGNTRMTEEPVITIIVSTAARPANSILLAHLTIDTVGRISPPDESVRQLASLLVDGNVGVGTRLPLAGLEINRRDTNHVALMLSSSGPGWGSGVQFKNTTPHTGKTYGIYSDSWSGSLHIADVDTGVDRIVVDKDGNVGIGTTQPTGRLTVERTLHGQGSLSFFTDSADISYDGGTDGIFEIIHTGINGKTAFMGTRIGVGTRDPSEMLEVFGRIKSGPLIAGPHPVNWDYAFVGVSTLDQTSIGNYALLQGGVDGPGRTYLNSPVDIKFRIGNVDKMILANNGNVGIGTADPGTFRLNIAGRTDNQLQNALVVSSDQDLRGKDMLNLAKFGGDGDYQILHKAAGQFGRNTLALHCHTDDAIGVYSTGWSPLLEVKGGSGDLFVRGNVGIGTSIPTHPLHVKTDWGFLALDSNTAGQDSGLKLMEGGNAKWHIYNAAPFAKFCISRDGLSFHSLTIDQDGKVGISNLSIAESFQLKEGTVFKEFQSGTEVIGSSSLNQKSSTINFGHVFSTLPSVIVTARGRDNPDADTFAVSTRAIKNESFQVNVKRLDSIAGWAQTLQLDWFAWTQG